MEKYLELFETQFKSPEKEFNNISTNIGNTVNSQKNINIRRQVLEIEELTQQLRWHILEAVRIYYENPEIKDYDKEFETSTKNRLLTHMSTSSKLLLRQFIVEVDKVSYKSLKETRRGKLVAGWVLAMFIENILNRSISIFDRIANTVALISDTIFINDKVYFRSNKLETIKKNLPSGVIDNLIEISKDELFELIIKIRDESSHKKKIYSVFSDTLNSDIYENNSSEKITISDYAWKSNELFGLITFAYKMVCNSIITLDEVMEIKYRSI